MPQSPKAKSVKSVKGKAVVFNNFGEPDQVLKIEERAYSAPKPWQIRAKVLLRPINPSDLMTVRGVYGQKPPLPAVPGYEGMGVIEELGLLWRPFRKFLQGKRVTIGATTQGNGTWQEYMFAVPFFTAMPLPATLPDEQAAMLFVNPASALIMTRQILKPRKGEWLLQSAAGSALGHAVIKLGNLYGFKTINLVRRREQVAELKALGADEVIVTEEEDIVKRVMQITNGQGVRYAIDAVGGATGSAIAESLGLRGRLLIYGQLADENKIELDVRELIFKERRIEGFWLALWVARNPTKLLTLFSELQKLLATGKLESPVGEIFKLDEIITAAQTSERRGRGGKTLLDSR